ncbi:MAG: peptidase M13 [Alphaproteobacteria bacterium]|nr:peptidase M13 [Alphaproteobacteria bacterium]MBU1514316.1 peptidase M13 [Alphaproteobacteria bacterium]MBU2095960.1 peptidase M13 [Alphaproteobacteria bacterium]MBU2153058.1 peptidase M13 [Alphaproteobacteria bacterium]MBU2308515.1 peptidase M13 [Alphaproteobacteria bacterium]
MISKTRKILLSAGAATALVLMAGSAFAADAPAGDVSLASPKYGTWGFDLSGMDRSVKPGDDFFKFANGKWAERTEIPSDRSRYGNFNKLRELSDNRMHAILEDAAAGKLTDPDAAKIAAGYKAFMDEAAIEKLDAKPLAPGLAEIRRVKSKDEFTVLMGKANNSGFTSLLPVGIGVDAKAPTRYAVGATNGGLGLPDRDYYLKPDFAEKKAKYEAYVAQMLTMVGWDKPAENAKAIVAFETQLAEASWTRVERRDRDKTYNPMSRAELNAFTPGFDWNRYLVAAGLPNVDRIIVSTNTAFPKVAKIYADTPLDTLKAWQAFHVADDAAPYLSKRFVDANYAFRLKELAGQPEQQVRWKRAGTFMNGALGESVGRVYVARYFPPESKAKMDALVGDVRTALHARIETLAWMGPETRARALEKLSKFTVKIAYPDTWRDYSGLQLKPNDLYGNVERSTAYEWQRVVARLNGPVDKAEWGMTPQTVNAYYNFANNEIVFPAAILQPPFFDPDADPAINYGGIGGVIGHEISHGFDDQGRKSDGDGVLRDWWTAEDATKFKAQTDRLGAQYSAFEPLPGAKVQGGLTMGENIGDNGGLSLGLDAYHASLKGKPAPVIDGLTGDQRVFLGWAQVWREKSRDEALRQQVVTDPHSPAYYRVNGTIRNVPGWYTAWDIKPGDKLYVPPEQRVNIW